MAKESKVFSVFSSKDSNRIIFQRESFGWELNSISDNKVAMQRETTIPNYHKLTQYEREYDRNYNWYVYYRNRMDFHFISFIILTLLFVVPGITYILYKNFMKKNARFRLREMERIVNESRMLHFSAGNSGL